MTTERTERQKEAARLNGAKSRGPVTPEGKARSSTNATTHGLTAATVLLPGESEERFLTLLNSMMQAYTPANSYEVSLVEKMAALTWQQDRLLGIDTQTLAVQMEMMAPALDTQLKDLAIPTRIALAYRDLSDHSRVLPNLDRHASRIRRQFNQLRTELLALQKTRHEKFQNEPTDEQLIPDEQHTTCDIEPGTSATGPAHQTPAAGRSPSSSDSCLLASDSSRKLQNEPTGEQVICNQGLVGSDDVPRPVRPNLPEASTAAQITPAWVSDPDGLQMRNALSARSPIRGGNATEATIAPATTDFDR